MDIFWLFGGIFIMTVPIFYLWGFFAFVQSVFGSKQEPAQKSEPVTSEKEKFVDYFFSRFEEEPDLSLQDFLDEVRATRRQALMEKLQPQAQSHSAIAPESVLDASVTRDEEHAVAFSELVSEPAPREPVQNFSWSEWYADHSIDFILYLGAFMIVAAVSLFVGFQWESFDSSTRFGIVLAFTAFWYLVGIGVQRFLSLDSVTIAFLTIGAIITPFCGVAWQLFVIGDMQNFGTTWLITSAIGTLIYITLSLVYQRRHFTYFGNLSILATVLSLVEVSASPVEYYVLAGAVTAIILLAGRIAVKTLVPRLDAYLGQDMEYSALGVLVFSVFAGITLIPVTGLPFFSVEVLSVLIAVLIFACMYLTLYLNPYTVVIAQMLGIATFSHILLTFDLDHRIALYATLLAGIVLQIMMNRLLEERFTRIHSVSNIAGLLISGLVYLISIDLAEGGFLAIPAILTLMAHAVFYAMRFDKPYAWYIVSILSYPLTAHILIGLEIEFEYITTTVFMVVALAQMLVIRLTTKTEIQEAFIYPALLVSGFIGATSITLLMDKLTPTQYVLNLINPIAVLIAFTMLMLLESVREETLLKSFVPVIMACVPALFFMIGFDIAPAWMLTVFALTVSGLFWLAQRLTGYNLLYYVVFAAPYVALHNTLYPMDVAMEIYPVAYAILSAIIYLAVFLPEETDAPRQSVAIVATGCAGALAFIVAIDGDSMTMHYAGWVSAYTMIVMLWQSRSLLGEVGGDVAFSFVIYLQYAWHIIFLQIYVDSILFNDPQWYSAALATVILINMVNLMRLRHDADNSVIFLLQLGATAILMLPTLGQIIAEQTLIYFGLGVIYSLIIGGLGIMLSQSWMRTLASIALVLVVLSQSSEFLLNLPRWIVIGVVGFGLLGAGLYLSIRRRNVKKTA